MLEDDIFHRVEHLVDVLGICCTSRMAIDLLVGVLVLHRKLILNELDGRFVLASACKNIKFNSPLVTPVRIIRKISMV